MNLLIITQKVDKNDGVLGFMHGWITEFAKHCSSIIVICLQEEKHYLPKNVKVLSLGKEEKQSRLQYLLRFYQYIFQERDNYDHVFVHMNPVYVVLGGLFWKLLRKKIGFWYTHSSVNIKLKIAAFVTNIIFTASKQSFRLPSEKVKVVGHGIDTDAFLPQENGLQGKIILSVGRISSTKRQCETVKIFEKVSNEIPNAELHIVGYPVTNSDKIYYSELHMCVQKSRISAKIKFIGAVPHFQMPQIYHTASVLINLSKTGSLDKDVLEAMACGVLPVSTNEAFKDILPEMNVAKDAADAEKKLNGILNINEKEKIDHGKVFRTYVEENHKLKVLAKKIIKNL
ncbi:MAG: hypothetical protein A2Z91_06390 [Deltaproteobacteria bacterium GWA2_38_16]|nr:MAG: hypothetical protein A2Z91_06390 [Deltaproteobacteria bacterium GWA2_38_16]OGQ03671.1 MAG: hypothetical protein A3D19_02390 [Deltaproteobacteria bacterium RIFCSPHIGHO2_02_FULL_38_15]OGQ31026.1 MAG: hypothetical protein A3A72_07620 [Deltaproteobacteria bacterium RIFCSPLOWO2_01_FULL_38_9]